jgi:hypothetical protein
LAFDGAGTGFGRFEVEGLTFVVDDGHTALALEAGDALQEIAEDALDLQLEADLEARRVVLGLGVAPLSSWALARLARVADGTLGFEPGLAELCEGGAFVVDLFVLDRSSGVAKVQLQGDAAGLGLLGVARSEPVAARVISALVAALLAEPLELRPIRVAVLDPEREAEAAESAPAEYGWDEGVFLGRRAAAKAPEQR